MTEQELLLERILEAEKIAGSLTNLAKLSGINYVQIVRVKSFLRGTANLEQKRSTFSVKNLQKLANAIGEDITFFTDENYVRKNAPISSMKRGEMKSVNDTVAENLKLFMETNGITAYKLSKDLGIDISTITRFIKRDIYEVKFAYLYKISEFYNIPIDYFTGNACQGKKEDESVPVEFFNSVRVSAGSGIENFNETPDGYYTFPSIFFKNIKNIENIKCLRVAGNSMFPVFDEGDYIFVDISQRVITPEQGIYVIRIDGELYVKGVQKIPGGFQLLSYNKSYEPIVVTAEKYNPDSVMTIGRVVAAFTLKNYY